MLKLMMIGCGKVGKPTADLFEELGHDVKRFDTAHNSEDDYLPAIKDRDLIFIAVPTPHDADYDGSKPSSHLPPKNFDYSMLESAVRKAAQNTTCPIVIISTVLPGTIRKLFWDILDRLIYNPYLIGMGTVKNDLANPDIIIVGTELGNCNDAVNKLYQLYAQMTNQATASKEKFHLGTFEEAEAIKIFYNTFISTKLALVNMIQDISQRIGYTDVDVVTDALKNASSRIVSTKYMTAGMGDGGPCHPRDNIALRWLASNYNLGYDIFDAVMQSREAQAHNIAKDLCYLSYKYKLDIYIHGETFKPGIDLCDGSYSRLIAFYVNKIMKKPAIFLDPNTTTVPSEVKGVILLAHNLSVIDNYNTRETYTEYCKFLPGSIVVDPWRTYQPNDESIKVIHYGNTRPSSP